MKTPCDRCEGRGTIPEYDPVQHHAKREKCPRCNGAGFYPTQAPPKPHSLEDIPVPILIPVVDPFFQTSPEDAPVPALAPIVEPSFQAARELCEVRPEGYDEKDVWIDEARERLTWALNELEEERAKHRTRIMAAQSEAERVDELYKELQAERIKCDRRLRAAKLAGAALKEMKEDGVVLSPRDAEIVQKIEELE